MPALRCISTDAGGAVASRVACSGRVTPIATHTRGQLDRALDAFAKAAREVGVVR